jgi:NAD+ synthase
MTDRFRLALAQLNPTVGDIAGNLAKARAARADAAAKGADAVAYSECYLSGYTPEDLVLKPAFQAACAKALAEFAADTADGGPAVLVGVPWRDGDKLHNAYAYLDAGKIQAIRYKVDLPNYGPFDEKRVFDAGPLPGPVMVRGVRLGVPICEDIWTDQVTDCLAETGAEILVVPNGSPYWRDKSDERIQIAVARVVETGLPMVYLNQVGGQDELVFDGASFGIDPDRTLAFQMPAFVETVEVVDYGRKADGKWHCVGGHIVPLPEGSEADWKACVLGLGDYVRKNRFPGVVLGLSGGIDSAVVAAMCVDALGADKVHAVMLPYRYTSSDSLHDAEACAKALGIRYDVVSIAPAVEGFEALLAPVFAGTERDLTEENLQSRTRGTILMAISNKFGSMVVTTGNKSEMSVGYATLYGDMNGGFNPIKDLYKMQVFAAAHWRNANTPHDAAPGGEVIPENIIVKPPSAELRPDQKDEDSLPPYPVLDAILERLVERELPLADIVADGYDEAVVRRVESLLRVAEYKRRQAAPGVKVTIKNFGRDRRYPITNAFRDPGVPVAFDVTPVKKAVQAPVGDDRE